MAERQFGPYRLVRQIAVGGMAELHLAKTKGIAGFEKYVALKMIHPNFAEDEQFVQMLIDEAKISVQLTHVNIAHTFDLGRVGDTYYITMEFVDGADLYHLLRKSSELDVEMPLDVCAFIAKEMTTGLDYAHRKKDMGGTPLGIVHRDVSPQNVLVSYAGEIKLVDFGIAKAAMKAKQTAVGVIKGKYYYMSPEQAWGDVVDHRSDIFSAGIVLYEMMTGQMLYLEEDLHRLLELVRNANIAPPSKLRKNIPPQLERIVMHALAKAPADRYQSAADFAADLERFLHGYSPVFAASKIANHLRAVLGESGGLPAPDPTGDDGSGIPMSTQRLEGTAVVRESSDIRDENSVIYRLPGYKAPSLGDSEDDGLFETEPTAAEARRKPTTPMPLETPARVAAARAKTPSTAPRGAVLRAQPRSPDEPTRPAMAAISEDARPSTLPRAAVNAPPAARSRAPSAPPPNVRGPSASRDRDGDETTRPSVAAQRAVAWPSSQAPIDEPDEDEDAGERTVITAAPGFGGNGFFDVRTNAVTHDGVPAMSSGPDDHTRGDQTFDLGDGEGFMVTGEIDGATQADPVAEPPAPVAPRQRPLNQRSNSAAMLAKTPTPSVSELRKPRESRRTPSGGVPVASVLQAIVGAAGSEPMPSGGRPQSQDRAPTPVSQMPTMITSNAPMYSSQIPGPAHGTSQHPWPVAPGHPTPYPGFTPTNTQQPAQGFPPPPNYGAPQGYPPQYQQQPYPPQAQPYSDPSAPAHSGYPPGYGQPMVQQPLPNYGGRTPARGELATMQVETLPERYRIQPSRPRWLLISLAAMVSVVGAAVITFFVIRQSRESHRPSSLVIDSVPEGAQVFVDNVQLPTTTPATFTARPGERHDVRVELAKHKPYHEAAVLPAAGGELRLNAVLQTLTGRIIIDSLPSGADIYIDGQLRGHTPTKLEDIDLEHVQKLELRHREFGTKVVPLTWPEDGVLTLNVNLKNP